MGVLLLAKPYDLVGGSGSTGGALQDFEQCNVVGFGHAAQASPYSGLLNTFGKGSFVLNRDFTASIRGWKSTWPNRSIIEFSWPKAGGSGIGAFAYGYPCIIYGGSNYVVSSPYGVTGPWPMKIKDLARLTVSYDLATGGNRGSYDTLLDSFVTASPSSTDGSYVAEVSFFPQANAMPFCSGGSVRQFSFGHARVGLQGQQICVEPCNAAGSARVDMLAATIDLKEVLDTLVALGIGGLTAEAYVRGWQLGPECQVPAAFNSGPYQGALKINALGFDWA